MGGDLGVDLRQAEVEGGSLSFKGWPTSSTLCRSRIVLDFMEETSVIPSIRSLLSCIIPIG